MIIKWESFDANEYWKQEKNLQGAVILFNWALEKFYGQSEYIFGDILQFYSKTSNFWNSISL